MTLDSLIREPAEVYHARSRYFLGSHRLADFRTCPLLYRQKQLGLVPDQDSESSLVGRAAHVAILEGQERLEAEFAIGGPIDPRTGQPFGSATKAWAEWAEAQAKPVLNHSQAALVEELAAAVHRHTIAAELLGEGVPEGVVRRDYRGVLCQARIDWVNPSRGVVDLKTCDDLACFEADVRRFGYAHQLAFYRALLAIQTGDSLPVYLIAVEKKPPYRCGVWLIDEGVLAAAERENEAALDRLSRCRQHDQWPTGYEELRVFSGLT